MVRWAWLSPLFSSLFLGGLKSKLDTAALIGSGGEVGTIPRLIKSFFNLIFEWARMSQEGSLRSNSIFGVSLFFWVV